MDTVTARDSVLITPRRARQFGHIEAVEKPPNHFFDFWKLNEKQTNAQFYVNL